MIDGNPESRIRIEEWFELIKSQIKKLDKESGI